MIVKRKNVFETNSSSMHALSLYCDILSILSESEFEDFKSGKINITQEGKICSIESNNTISYHKLYNIGNYFIIGDENGNILNYKTEHFIIKKIIIENKIMYIIMLLEGNINESYI